MRDLDHHRLLIVPEGGTAGGGPSAPTEPGRHALPELGYAYDALEPHIDAATLELHHSKHHQAYVSGLNDVEQSLAEAQASGNFAAVPDLERWLAFHGSGHLLHSVYWSNMGPTDRMAPAPSGELAKRLERDFGSLDAFRGQFTMAAQKVEGNGWAMLAYQPQYDRLYTLAVLNHQNGLIPGAVPLLVCDVWEHAYYLSYQNRRPDYVKAWWNVVDWSDVGRRFTAALR